MNAPLPGSRDNYLKMLQYIFLVCAIMYFGRDILVLLSFALLVSFVLYPVCSWLERKKFPRMMAIFSSLLLLLIPVTVLIVLLLNQFSLLRNEWSFLEPKINDAITQLSQHVINEYAVSKERQLQWLTQVINQSSTDLLNYLITFMYSSTFALTLLILIPVFAALFLYYRHTLVLVTYQLFPYEKKEDLRKILVMSVRAYYNFIIGMTIVYLIVGLLNGLGLFLLGIPNPFFFGFVAAILTFIPYLGIIIGSLLPIVIAWITYSSIWYPLGVVLVFSVVQYLEANVIFPLVVSNRLKINALATLVVIFIGGMLWGIAGMILFVPLLGIVKLIADRHPQMKTLSTLLGTENTE